MDKEHPIEYVFSCVSIVSYPALESEMSGLCQGPLEADCGGVHHCLPCGGEWPDKF